jgi:MFS family permease
LRQHKATLGIVFLIVFIDLVGFGIVIPFLPLYAEEYGPSPMVFGLLMASFSLMQFMAAPILGRLSDRYGRRPVLLVSLVGSVLGYLLFAFAGSIAMLFVPRIIDGISGGNISTAQVVIADITDEKDRAKGMGLIGAAFGHGIAAPSLSALTSKLVTRDEVGGGDGHLPVAFEPRQDRGPVLGRAGVRLAGIRVAVPHRVGVHARGERGGRGAAGPTAPVGKRVGPGEPDRRHGLRFAFRSRSSIISRCAATQRR